MGKNTKLSLSSKKKGSKKATKKTKRSLTSGDVARLFGKRGLRFALASIGKALPTVNNLQSVLAAMRGPDDIKDSGLKIDTTAILRVAAFGQNWAGDRNDQGYIPNYKFNLISSSHFRGHINDAAEALGVPIK